MGINVEAEKRAYKKFTSAGMTPEGACALIGNIEAESDGFYANRVEYLCIRRLKENGKNYTDDTYTAAVDSGAISKEEFLNPLPGRQYGYGYAQWTSPGRKAGLYDLAKQRGVSIADEDMQLDYLLQELESNYRSVLAVLKSTESIREASDIVLKKFEQPANTSESVCTGRAARGQKFYDNYVKEDIKVSVTAKSVIKIAKTFLGCKESDGSHKKIIDIYNGHKPLARGYKVKYTDSWCDAFVSAVAIQAGAAGLIGTECGVEEHVRIFKNKGIWIEDGTITPKKGDIIVFNWDDGTQPNDGYSDHIGFVEKVSGGVITTIEGNYSNAVKRREIAVGHGNIRGYARPKYAADGEKENTVLIGKCTVELKTFLKGAQDNQIKAIQRILRKLDYLGKDGNKLKIDGSLGDNTAYAIERFQRDNGLTGINFGTVAEKTWLLLLNAD